MARPRWRGGLVVFMPAGSRMAGPFDATLKQLLDACAADWLGWLAPLVGLPPPVAADPLDPDLSTVQPAADKVFRLRPPRRSGPPRWRC